MVEFSLSAGGSIPCWPFFYYNSKGTDNRKVQCCWPFCLYKRKNATTHYNCGCCIGYKKSDVLFTFWFLFLFIYHKTLSTFYWTICLLFIYRRKEDGSKKIRILGFFVINLPSGGSGSEGFYITILYVIKFHRKANGYRLWILLLFIRKQPHRLTVTLFPFFSYRWRDNYFIEYQFLIYYSYCSLPPEEEFNFKLLFPIYLFTNKNWNDGRTESRNYLLLGLIAWHKHLSGKKYLRFLVYTRSKTEDTYAWRILYFIIKYKNNGRSKKFNITPLFRIKLKPTKTQIYLIPFFYYYSSEHKFIFWLILFLRYSHDGNDEYFTVLFPFFYKFYSDHDRYLFYWLWFSSYRDDHHNKYFTIIPIIYHKENDRVYKHWVFPFYFHIENKNKHTKVKSYFPIVTNRYKNNILRSRFYLLCLYGYHCPIEGDENYLTNGYDILWPFIHISSNPEADSHDYRVIPFFYEKRKHNETFRFIFPCYVRKETPRYISKVLLIGIYYKERFPAPNYAGTTSFYLSPIWCLPPYVWYFTRNANEIDCGFWPLFSKRKYPDYLTYSFVWPLFRFFRTNHRKKTTIALLYRHDRTLGADANYFKEKRKILFLYYKKKTRNQTSQSSKTSCGWFGCFKPCISCIKRKNQQTNNDPHNRIKTYINLIFSYSKYRDTKSFALFWIFRESYSLLYYKKTGDNEMFFRILFLIKIKYNKDGVLTHLLLFWIFNVSLIHKYVSNSKRQFYIFLLYNHIDRGGDAQSTSILWLFHFHFTIFYSNEFEKKFWVFPFYYSKGFKDNDHQKIRSYFGWGRIALIYSNNRDLLWYFIPFYISSKRSENDDEYSRSFIGFSHTFALIYYKPNEFLRFFPIFWKSYKENSKNKLSIIYLFHPSAAIISSGNDWFYIFILYYHYAKNDNSDDYSFSFLWFGNRHATILHYSAKRFYIFLIYYNYIDSPCTRFSILWLFSGKFSLIHYCSDGISRIFPICSTNSKKPGTTIIKLFFGLIHIKTMDGYFNGRFAYRLARFKYVDGSVKRFEINPFIFCNYTNPDSSRHSCLACGGCAGHTKRGVRCCWCLNAKF